MKYKEELIKEIEILKTKTDATINQLDICFNLVLDRLNDIDNFQDYLIDKLIKNKV